MGGYGESAMLRNLSKGYGGAYAGMSAERYGAAADSMDSEAAANQQAQAMRDAQDRQREAHERALQAQEQQRRQYDSETQRQLGQKKFNVLSGLLGGPRTYG